MNESAGTVLVALTEDTISKLMALRHHSNEPLADVVRRLAGSNGVKPREQDNRSRKPSGGGPRYVVEFLGEDFSADTLSDALSITLNALADLDSSILPSLERIGGRNRRHVARSPDRIHAGRPDLNKRFTREIRPGWWIGTNYSQGDTCRIIKDACRIATLTFGRDIKLIDTHQR